MRDAREQERIREQYASAPGIGHHVERVMGERENGLAHGQEGAVERAEAELEALGYDTPEKRASAAEQRKAAAEKKAAAEQADEGADDGEKAAEARKQAPAERKAPQGRQQSTQRPAPRQET